MKSRQSYLSLVVLLAAVALSVTACPPPFFIGSNVVNPPFAQTTLMSPEGEGLFQTVIAPGTLAIGAKNPDDTVMVYCDLGGDDTTRRLSLWDSDSDAYVALDGNESWAALEMRDHVVFRPAVLMNQVDFSWTYMMDGATVLKHKPVLVVDLNDVLDAMDPGTIVEMTIKHDINDSGTVQHVFQTGTFTMVQDRVGYLRRGAEDTTAPVIRGASISDNQTNVALNAEISIEVSEKLGNLQAILVNQGQYSDDTADNVYYSLAVTDQIIDGSTYEYVLTHPKDLVAGTDYYLVLLKKTNGDNGWPLSGGNMPYTQDMSGNAVLDSNTIFHTDTLSDQTFDLSEIAGGSTVWIDAYYLKFTTAP